MNDSNNLCHSESANYIVSDNIHFFVGWGAIISKEKELERSG